MADRHRASRAPSPAVGAELTICCMSARRMSWQQTAARTGAANRSHNLRWVSACLRDHGRAAGCRSGDRYQAIRSAPGRSRFGASACSRSATLASLAASLASVTASHCRRRPFSYHTARHRSPARRAGYTVIPASSSTTTRPSPRVAARPVPVAKIGRPLRRGRAAAATGRVTPARDGCGFSVGILAPTGADCPMGLPLFLRFAQVRGLMGSFPGGGQGQGRTADLPLFRRMVAPGATAAVTEGEPALPAHTQEGQGHHGHRGTSVQVRSAAGTPGCGPKGDRRPGGAE